MLSRKTHFWLSRPVLAALFTGVVTGGNAASSGQAASGQTASSPALSPVTVQAPVPTPSPANASRKSLTFDEFIDSTIRQERRLIALMRFYKPIVETYIQEQKPDSGLGTSPRKDDYFLSRLDPTGSVLADREFESPERSKLNGDPRSPRNGEAFAPAGFAQAAFPDVEHFDRQSYIFEFVRWETLGDVRCALIDVKPHENSSNRGFVGRIWVEDQDFNIVRFTGTYVSKQFSKRAFHFDSWRLNTLSIMWMPAYVYTQESDPRDPSSHGLWFKAQTRIWGYDLTQAGDHREFAKPLTDAPVWFDPKRHEASQDLSPELTVGTTTYPAEDDAVERMQVAGLMAPHGPVDDILQTVVNNLLITNGLDTAGIRCRVLLTTPLESFVIGRTIVVSRGLLDVLPDEAALAAVLAHELAHIVLLNSLGADYLAGFNVPFSDLEIFAKLDFHFSPEQEAAADKKGLELFSKSPYKNQISNAALFLQALELRSPQLPNLLHGRFSNDFARSHLVGMPAVTNAPKQLKIDNVDQIAALPLGSRIKVDPWSDRIVMLPQPSASRPLSPSEKMPFEVAPFFPYLKRLEQ